MNRKLLIICCIILLTVSCQRTKREKLAKKWQAVALQNAWVDSILTNGPAYIDTIGNHTDTAADMQLYGTTNIDSLKKYFTLQLDSLKQLQQQALLATTFDFKKNGIAFLNFNGNENKTKWYLNDNGSIVLDATKEPNGIRLKMDIEELEDTLLKIKFTENGKISTVTFKPANKD